MRKFIALVLCVFLMVLLAACQNTQDPSAATEEATQPYKYDGTTVVTFPEGTVLCGYDLSGKLGNAAYSIISKAVENYTLTVKINDDLVVIPGEEMSLTYHEDAVTAFINAIKSGEDVSGIMPITYNAKQLQSRIAYHINKMPTVLSITYDSSAKEYVLDDYIPGTVYNLEPVVQELDPVILSFTPGHSTTAQGNEMDAELTAQTSQVKQVLNAANAVVRTALTYGYTPDGSKTTYEALTIDQIAGFLTIDDNLKATVNEDAVMAYAETMAEKYSVGDNDGKFLTSQGEYIDLKITYADQAVDTEALAEDIIYCIENGVSGARSAPYQRKGRGYTYDLGGNYVEIDLSKQRLWVYNDYECKLYTPIVTGNLSEEWDTPTGVFKVYQRIYPTRPGRVFRYWVPFLGAYGLHDANWRSEFRSDEYLFEGSHGCVNIPPENFLVVYDHVSIGTPVVIYKSAESPVAVTQVLSGTEEYNVGLGAKKFTLDTTAKYTNQYGSVRDLTYTSDNPEVASVTSQGVVKVHKTGTAHITVESYDWYFCPSEKMVITVHVHEDCSKVGHMIVNWKQTKAPTCTAKGTEVGTCTSCDYTETRDVEITHDFYFSAYMHDQQWIVTEWPTCSETGEKYRVCQDCGYKEVAEIPAESHMFCDWTITEATETQDGQKTATCYHCKKLYEEIIPAGT